MVSASAWLRLGAAAQPATVEFTESLLSRHRHLLTASPPDTAHHAVRPSGGGSHSTEGSVAHTFAVHGLSVVSRDISHATSLSLSPLFFFFFNRVLTLELFSWGRNTSGLDFFVQILTVKYRISLLSGNGDRCWCGF